MITFTRIKRPFILWMICACAFAFGAKETAAFKEWSQTNNKKIDIFNEWNIDNPHPYRDYFNAGSSECIQNWFISLGPLGLNTIMHDRTWTQHFSACDEAKPIELSDDIGLIFNAFEVKIVKKNSPAKGLVKKGDLILAFDGEMIKEAQLTYVGVPMDNKFLRGLEIDAGLAIDKAEGRGSISLLILRAPNSVKKQLHKTLLGLRKWKKVADIQGDFKVNIKDVDLCRISSPYTKAKVPDFTISNEEGVSYHYRLSDQKWSRLVNNQISIPKGSWQLSGYLKHGGSIEVLERVKLPKQFQKYLKVVKFKILKIGSFGKSFNPFSLKAQNYSQILARRLAIQQEENGSWQARRCYANAAFHTSICGLALMAYDDPQYAEVIKKAAHFVAQDFWGKWGYPAGMRLIFLSEYYLRTKDPTIKDAIRNHIKIAGKFVMADYTVGHGAGPGYGGNGYIGAGSMIACGLAVASKTGLADAEDILLLDKMLQRIQELSPEGTVPYGRSQRWTKRGYSKTKGGGCGTGGYFFASSIRGTGALFRQAASKKFGLPPWGSDENGHAASVLHFAWAMLVAANCGSKSLVGSMSTYLWRFTTHRECDGLINKNNYRTEYHKGDGVIGEPYWRTASYLLLMNAYKKNLAISGKSIYQARKFRDYEQACHPATSLLNYVKRNWIVVEAALGKYAPKSLRQGIVVLEQLEKSDKLDDHIRTVVKKYAPIIAKSIRAIPVRSHNYNKSQLIEMVYGVDLEFALTPNLTPGLGISTVSRKSVSYDKKLFHGSTDQYADMGKDEKNELISKITSGYARDRASGSKKKIEYAVIFRPMTRIPDPLKQSSKIAPFMKGIFDFTDVTMTLRDPSGKYLRKPLVISKSELTANGSFGTIVSLPISVDTFFYAYISYKLDGVPVQYKLKIPVPTFESRTITPSLTRVFVKGTVSEDYAADYTARVKLYTGKVIGCERSNFTKRAILAGSPCLFELSPTGLWAQKIHSVVLYKPEFRVVLPQSVSVSDATINGSIDKLRDMDNNTSVTINSRKTACLRLLVD